MNAIELLDQYVACETWADLARVTPKLADELRRLHAENEALRKDAVRYAWIRDKHQYTDREWEIVQEVDREGWDEAIDAAMEESK